MTPEKKELIKQLKEKIKEANDLIVEIKKDEPVGSRIDVVVNQRPSSSMLDIIGEKPLICNVYEVFYH